MFKSKDRVVVKVSKNEWYLGVIERVTKKRIEVLFDDGATAKIAEEDWKDVKLASSTKKKKALTNAEARDIMVKRSVLVTVKPKTPKLTPAQRAAKIVFVPPATGLPFKAQFHQMDLWLRRVVAVYNFSGSAVESKEFNGTVSVSRTFWAEEISATHKKYKMAVSEMHAAFSASPLWRSQMFAGHRQFFSHDGLFLVAIYDTDNPMGPGRRLGFYVHLKPV